MEVLLSGQIQRSIEILQVIHPWYDDREFGRVMAATRAIPRVSVKAQGHTRSITSGRQRKSHRHLQNFEPHTDCSFVNYQTQHRANPMHQPLKLARIVSIITSRGGRVPESHHHSHSSVVATLGLPVSSHGEKKPHIYRRRRVVQATNDAIRRQRSDKSKPGIGRPIAFPMVCQEFTSHRTGSVTFGSLPSGAKKRATCFVVIWTHRVP